MTRPASAVPFNKRVRETLLSLHLLQDNRAAPQFAEWRAHVGAHLDREPRPLLLLAPPRGYSPDFLTPAAAADGLEAGLDTLRHTPATNLHHDLDVLSAYQTYTGQFRALGEGEPALED